ncbi:low affinity immunoglobulin gamma Fc region receptor III-like [Leuresthes tenuis]|uniref:low affinity immunoglobulin gamma Fc region receptor III-like n=1 Tax=Leuresthes tenuis TaxID=355514 RepID=UPI003B511B3F
MEVTALHIHKLTSVFLLLAARAEPCYFAQADAFFPHISPNKLQFFEYDPISIHCEGIGSLAKWRVMSKSSSTNSSETCNTAAPSCTINPAFERCSGKYWCENEEGGKSVAANISITDGSVIMEIPAQPVTEGSSVTLRCVKRENLIGNTADYYKDGHFLSTSYEGDWTIREVSKSDEGLYKCSISGAGESPESWLSVLKPDEAPCDGTYMRSSSEIPLVLCTVSVALATLLLVAFGAILYRKRKASNCFSSGRSTSVSQSHEDRTEALKTFKLRFSEDDGIYSFIQ